MERGVITEAKEPRPFLPPWLIKIGPLTERGDGLIAPSLFSMKDLADSFSVPLGAFKIEIKPKAAQIWLDSQLVFQGEADKPHRLLWFRRMEQQIATHDRNSRAAQCLWYGFGLQWEGGQHGYRLYESGKITNESIS